MECDNKPAPAQLDVAACKFDRQKLFANGTCWLAGSFTASIFQVLPQLQLFRPNGINENYQWCGYNFTSASIPNGFGWGGQVRCLLDGQANAEFGGATTVLGKLL